MKPYLSFLSARFKAMLQYRTAALAGMVTQVFWGFIRIMIFEAFYASSTAVQPMTLPQVVSYVWLGQALIGLLPWNADRDIIAMIRTGGVSYELLRPLDLYSVWYVRTMAWRTGATLLRCVPLILFASVVVRLVGLGSIALDGPVSLEAAALFSASMVLAILLSGGITTLLHVSMMWTIAGEGAQVLVGTAVSLFSGMIIPLPLFPDWFQIFLRLMPFHGLVDTPFRIYTGNLAGTDAVFFLLQQLVWVIIIIAAGRVLIHRGLSKLVVQGG